MEPAPPPAPPAVVTVPCGGIGLKIRAVVFEGVAFLVAHRNRLQRTVALLVAGVGKRRLVFEDSLFEDDFLLLLVQRPRRPLGTTRIDGRRTNQTSQAGTSHDDLIQQGPEPRYVRLLVHGHPEQITLERIDDDQHIAELRRQDVPSVVPVVFTPHNINSSFLRCRVLSRIASVVSGVSEGIGSSLNAHFVLIGFVPRLTGAKF